jgi:predicted PurR-regulated permease PerM
VKFDRLMEQLVGVFALVVLVGGALMVVAPFVTALLWGGILAYCSWQPFKKIAAALGGHRAIATLLVVLLIFCVLIGPIFYAGFAFSAYIPEVVAFARDRLGAGIPPLPDWLSGLPVIGVRLQEAWDGIASRNPEMVARLRELSGPLLRGALGAGLSVLHGLGLLILSVLFAAVFYLNGETAAEGLSAGMHRVAGGRADYLLKLIGGTVKGVVYGILGTSLVQAVLCAIGFAIAGLPSPGMLGLITFFLAIIPGGPLLVVIPAAAWLVQHDATNWAIFVVVWALVVGVAIDNVLKPILIGKTSNVPFILVLVGVLGGAAAFGLLGVFVGPTLLAVTHAVLRDWVRAEAAATERRAAHSGQAMIPPGGDRRRQIAPI